jgi:hypothetical protein
MAATDRNDWLSIFFKTVLSLFLGLPLGGLLFALTSLGLAVYQSDPITQTPWALTFRTVLAWFSFVFLGGFAWTPEDGYRSLHAWYAAGVVLGFVLLMKPWRRRNRS